MKRLLLCMLLLAVLALTGCAKEGEEMQLLAINVGKGDAMLLSYGNTRYLIDTGTTEHWGDLSRALKVLEVDHLNGVIITHTDKDHCGGMRALAMSSIAVDGWYAPAFYTGVKEGKHPMVEAAALRGQQVKWLFAGDELPLGEGALSVIGPRSRSETENCNSLVLVAHGGGGRMLLAGDMEFPEEEELLAAGVITHCQLLKVGNHGENDATSEAFLNAVAPKVVVISTSTVEEPDTPSNRVMRLLAKSGAEVWETQDAPAGVLATINSGVAAGHLLEYDPFPAVPQGITLADRDAKEEHIRIRNDSAAAVDLSGWYIVSDRGGELFVLPGDTILQPGGELLISTLSSDEQGDLVWPEKKVWHKSKDDTARLYDVYGQLVCELK